MNCINQCGNRSQKCIQQQGSSSNFNTAPYSNDLNNEDTSEYSDDYSNNSSQSEGVCAQWERMMREHPERAQEFSAQPGC